MVILLAGLAAPASAEDRRTRQDREAARAEHLRQQSRENAERNLQYPSVPVVAPTPAISPAGSTDYHALGLQIQRLGAMIQKLQMQTVIREGSAASDMGRRR